jgi:peroxiredoxin
MIMSSYLIPCKRLFFFFTCLLLTNSHLLLAQDPTNDTITSHPNPLSGLRLAGPRDIDPGTPLMLDPVNTPMYDEQLNLISPMDLMKVLMSNEFVPEPYIDQTKSVKVFVLRKATPEEKAMMQQMQQGGMLQEQSALVGTQAVDFEVVDVKGNKYKLSELKGKVVMLNFWFVECKPCVMEMPDLNALVDEFKGKEVVFLAIALNDKKQLKKFLKTTVLKYNVVSNGQAVADAFGVKGFPTNAIIDQSGVIHYMATGVGPNNKANLLQTLNTLLVK